MAAGILENRPDNSGQIIKFLLFSCISIGDELSAAAVTRGLGAPVKRTNVCEIGFHSKDYVVIAVTLVLSILYIYLSVSHVMHIGSTVRGELADDRTALDAIDAILPAGTLSGAPKIRACQLINDLENNKRGIYGGAIGYLDFTGNLDTCIAIRIAYKKNGKVFVRSGAGIVADSVPESEYQECINKAAAVVKALEAGGSL